MDHPRSPRLYITFQELGVTRRAIVLHRDTYEEVLLDAIKTFRVLADNTNGFELKCGHQSGQGVAWMEILPETWGVVADGDTLLLSHRQDPQSQTTAMQSSLTLVPIGHDAESTSLDSDVGVEKLRGQPARPIVTYCYFKDGKVDLVVHALSFLPDTYEEALDTAYSLLKSTGSGQHLERERTVLWVWSINLNGKRDVAPVPREQLIELVREKLKTDPDVAIVVIQTAKVADRKK